MENQLKQCLIYTRVSTADQLVRGGGIESQDRICRDVASRNGWEIKKVFSDGGISGKDIESRPQLKAMLDFLNKTKEPFVVLFYDISRLTRDDCDWGYLRKTIEGKGHRLADKTGLLAQNAAARLIANMEAVQAQYFRENNFERNEAFALECLKQGWWIYGVPPCYTRVKLPGDTRKTLIHKDPEASIMKEALEGFASARFISQSDVLNFINTKWQEIGKRKTSLNFIKRMLISPFYTGFFPFPKKNIPAQQWHIQPIIDTATFELIQDRLRGRNRVKHKKYNKHDERFPLRGFVKCPVCDRPLTGSMTKGGAFPYYQCQNAKCTGKKLANVSPKVLHGEFEDLLANIAPSASVIALTRALAKGIYQERHTAFYADKEAQKKRIASIEREKESVLEAFLKATTDAMQAACENKMTALDKEKDRLTNDLETQREELMPFDDAFGYVSDFVGHPHAVWRAGDYDIKQIVLDLCFSDRISYNKEQKFGTPSLSPIFGLFESISGDTSQVVPMVGIGPTTPPLPRVCSTTEPHRHKRQAPY